ncbi:hypothetical protein QF042_004666 [Pedobacter sp. W3I1]|uniref:hypothetical protein n=1 Tax=Pedobacter sp. W3I1 TaxID=3042291 RepID=UPI0027858C4B|nr:hypothetical protein [Pedobacter sp. W3I1]MDQ0641101.1 hypothetical protein [Pedobacter sp. W3I1]
MKTKILPETLEKEELPFGFKRQPVSDEDIRKHWDRIAARISGGGGAKHAQIIKK